MAELPTNADPLASEIHNVIIFGAGASFDAGIPLMPNFVNRMWEYAFREKTENAKISEEDIQILSKANNIRVELERFNSRASFDNRNIEDILSLLSFEAISSNEAMAKYETLVSAIGRTIELACRYKYFEGTPETPLRTVDNYHEFWRLLLGPDTRSASVALLTFNYDLVLERTLWQIFHSKDENYIPVDSCRLSYSLGSYGLSLQKVPHQYRVQNGNITTMVKGTKANFRIAGTSASEGKPTVEIPYLKLHGSLNWKFDRPEISPSTPPTEAVPKPLILPPVFNKMSSRAIDSVWAKALQVLRTAKHIIIVGYSLPRTDIYMQYFLKSAIGPNSDLQRIIVFDPKLFKEGEDAQAMRKRYEECFAPQFTDYITFQPPRFEDKLNGTLRHFINELSARKESLLFYP